MSRTPPHMTTLVGVAQRGWSGHIHDGDLSHPEFLFFLFVFFAFFIAPQRYFLTDRNGLGLYAKTCLLVVSTIFVYIYGIKAPKTSLKWAGISISQPFAVTLKIFASNFTDNHRLRKPVTKKNCKIISKEAVKGSRDLLLEFRDPFNMSGRLKRETSNLARMLITKGTNEKTQN